MSQVLKTFELASLTTSGANSVIFTFREKAIIRLLDLLVNVTTSTTVTSPIITIRSTGNPFNQTARLNTFAGTITTSTSSTVTAIAGTTLSTPLNLQVIGVGTAFLTEYAVGDVIRTAGGNERRITAILSNTALLVSTAWGAIESGVTHSRGTTDLATITVGIVTVGTNPVTKSVGLDGAILEASNLTVNTSKQQISGALEPYSNKPFFTVQPNDSITYAVTTTSTAGAVTPTLVYEGVN